jgi:hypothetical protein
MQILELVIHGRKAFTLKVLNSSSPSWMLCVSKLKVLIVFRAFNSSIPLAVVLDLA